MRKKKPKTYHIDDFKKFLNVVNEENFDRLITDFCLWVGVHIETMKKLRAELPEETKGRENSEICDVAFVWTDDGKHIITGISMTNPITGEVTEKRFKEHAA